MVCGVLRAVYLWIFIAHLRVLYFIVFLSIAVEKLKVLENRFNYCGGVQRIVDRTIVIKYVNFIFRTREISGFTRQ